MNRRTTLTIIAAVVVVGLAALIWFWYTDNQISSAPDTDQSAKQQPATQEPKNDEQEKPAPAPTTNINSEKGTSVEVTKPLSGATVSTPLTVEGQVPGSWSFEGSFPLKVMDANHQIIGRAEATLSGDWMTEKMVSFSGEITFDRPATDTGFLILEKANPSGLSENADQVEVPVQFN